MEEKKYRLPETSVVTENCLSKDYIFEYEARSILKKIGAIIHPEDGVENEKAYYENNIIGIIGGRGSGKTSLIASILETIKNKGKGVYMDITSVRESNIICLTDIIDPKAIPDFIGIIDLVLASLFYFFKEHINIIKETERESLFQQFERLNKIVSILSQTQRTDVIENPGDLYDLASLVTLRKALEDLVNNLLKAQIPEDYQAKKEKQKDSVFILAIDDFDLDTNNSLRMLYELSTFLNIKGIIFMLAMDDQVFNYEIERARIKEMSDFGRATEQIGEIASLSRSGGRFRNIEPRVFKDTLARYGVERIASQATEYRFQLTTKLIPLDFRFDMKAHGVANYEDKFRPRVDALFDWLFGFSGSHLSGKGKLGIVMKAFCTQVRDALVVTSNLRSRNQMLNQILDLLEERTQSQKSVDWSTYNEEKNLKALSDALKNYPLSEPNQGIEKNFLKKLAAEIDKVVENGDLLYFALDDSEYPISDYITDGESGTSIYRLFQPFWTTHPCAYYAYQRIVSMMDWNDNEEFANLYYDLLTYYKNNIGDAKGEKINLQKSDKNYTIGKVTLSAMSLHENLFAFDYSKISRELRNLLDMLKGGSKIVKRDALNFLAELRDYFARKDGFPIAFLEEVNDLRKKMQGIPWTRESEQKREVLEELREELEKLRKYLI